jgi:aspartyl-tRNA(Asn)/glutamyl-tRNA(Gln) amidotransferase subunit A
MSPGALRIAADVRSGARRATDVLDDTAARIRAQDPVFNCFRTLDLERAGREAAAIDRKRAQGLALPPLAGVPYAVKDLFDIAGRVTLAGGTVNAANPAAGGDAFAVARLHAAGAVLLGTLNMDEHAYGFTTENTHTGPTRNPHDTRCVAGGSSGGSAAAVAAGLVPLALGSDTNGSIRVPASLCGVFGMKPTFGRLSRSGVFPFASSLDHIGHFAGSVDDLAAAYDLLQGADPADPACAQRPAEPVAHRLALPRRLRVGVLGGWFSQWAGDAARDAVDRVGAALDAHDTVLWAQAHIARSAAFIITGAEGGALHRPGLLASYAQYEPLSRDRLIAGSLIPASWVVQAQRARRAAYREILALLENFDLLLAPATPVCAPRIGSETIDVNGHSIAARASLGLLTQPISCVGLPVCTVPVWVQDGSGAGGTRADAGPPVPALPIGVQLIAPPWREELCLAAAAHLERAQVCGVRAVAPAPAADAATAASAATTHHGKISPGTSPR